MWLGAAPAESQTSKPAAENRAGTTPLPTAAPGDQVVIKRDPVVRIDPQKYRASLSLAAKRTVALVAPFDGVVRSVTAKIGQKVQEKADVVRLDNAVQKLQLQRAQSLLKVATLEQKLAGEKTFGDQRELLQAKVDAAKADVDLAQLQMDLTTVRAPFAGEVLRVLVSENQFVKAGEAVAMIGDTAQMQVEIPADRTGLQAGQSFPLKVDAIEVQGKVESLLPLNPRFDALRELFDSVTSALVVIDNPSDSLRPGQTVYVPLIPRQPVAEIPAAAVGNLPSGQRKVQVLREMIVRDVPVTVMGSVGVDRVFVNGPFADGDEVIYESSHQLADGFPLKPGTGGKSGDGKKPGNKPTQPAPNF